MPPYKRWHLWLIKHLSIDILDEMSIKKQIYCSILQNTLKILHLFNIISVSGKLFTRFIRLN